MRLFTKLVDALRRRKGPTLDTPTGYTQRVAVGTEAFRRGDYSRAEERFSAAFKGAEVNGTLNHRAAAALNNLGIVYKRQKRLDHAEVTLRRALRAYGVVEPDGSRTASVLHNLAGVYLAQERYAEAVKAYQQTIEMAEKIFGSKHPKLVKRLENYARALEAINDIPGANRARARAQAIRAAQKNS